MPSKYKVAIISSVEPWHAGGIERVIAKTSKRLKADFDMEIFCLGEKTGAVMWEEMPVNIFRRYGAIYPFSLSLYKELKRRIEQFALIHCYNWANFAPLVSILANKGRVPIIFSPYFHPIASQASYSIFRKFYDLTIGKYVFKNSDVLIYASKAEREVVESRYGIEKNSFIIYDGADIAEFKSAEPYDLEGRNLILHLGRLKKYKNVHFIIKAMKYLPDNFLLYIIGAGGYSSQLEELIRKLSLENRVKMLGSVPDEEACRWMKTCSVFVHLSEIETFGITCVEALAAGKPVVANDDGMGLAETARLFRDSISLIDVKRRPIRDIAKLIKDASQIDVNPDLNGFDWIDKAERIKDVYLDVLRRKL